MVKFYVITLCCVLFVLQALSDQPAESGVLITGGYSTTSTELYLPSSSTSCTLPGLPDIRYAHTEDQGLLCGGSSRAASSCLQWSPDTGSWEAAVTLDVERSYHISWTSNTRGTFLMGGPNDRTTTLITPDGSQEPGFPLKYNAFYACAIPDPDTDTVVVTGGLGTGNTVVRYGQQGWLEDLPDLIAGRRQHACSSFVSSGRVMFLVTGGYGSGLYFDSTETFDPMLGSWATSGAKLPRKTLDPRAVNINDRVFIIGGWSGDSCDDILEYHPEEDTITTVGHMIQAREYHAVSVVRADDYLPWCQ